MIRKIKSNNKDYIVVTTLFTVEEVETVITIQIPVTNLSKDETDLVHQYASYFFNRPIKVKPTPKPEPPKNWFSKLFGK